MPKRFRNAIGPNVRRLRVEKGLTQEQLAAKLGMRGLINADRVWLAKVESQIRSVFDFELAVIADVLGVQAGELLPGRDDLIQDLPDLHKGMR